MGVENATSGENNGDSPVCPRICPELLSYELRASSYELLSLLLRICPELLSYELRASSYELLSLLLGGFYFLDLLGLQLRLNGGKTARFGAENRAIFGVCGLIKSCKSFVFSAKFLI
jgi:hypothetical protein